LVEGTEDVCSKLSRSRIVDVAFVRRPQADADTSKCSDCPRLILVIPGESAQIRDNHEFDLAAVSSSIVEHPLKLRALNGAGGLAWISKCTEYAPALLIAIFDAASFLVAQVEWALSLIVG
jgi:hypothetical protein